MLHADSRGPNRPPAWCPRTYVPGPSASSRDGSAAGNLPPARSAEERSTRGAAPARRRKAGARWTGRRAIAACVIGGASLSGARGSAIGAACGALIIGVLNNGGNLLAINAFYLQIAIGALILVAVGFDQLNTRNAARG
jgi:hypothetical protein